jgi:alpha-methylacyl-CoA racemase
MTGDRTAQSSPAPLHGIRVVHLASLGPGPHAAMMLADLGADVVIVDRPTEQAASVPPTQDPRRRSQRSVVLDLKDNDGRAALLGLLDTADVLIEGMRPGAAERLGIGPEDCLARNPRLVYARMTGWGQDGPMAQAAGHDINYVALSGALDAMGDPDRPPPVPLNLLGDYAGGGLYLAFGVLTALFERERSGRGQVVDTAISDGVAGLTATTLGMLATGRWGPRGTNAFDGSRPWYRTYATRDRRAVAVGAIEPQFFALLLRTLGLDPADWRRDDEDSCRELGRTLATIFASEDQAHWTATFDGTDACVTPVLTFSEALAHPHHLARRTYVEVAGVRQPAPGPRLSRSTVRLPGPPPGPGADTSAVLAEAAARTEAPAERVR